MKREPEYNREDELKNAMNQFSQAYVNYLKNNKDLPTVGGLEEKYGVQWDENTYYLPELWHIQEIQNVNLKNVDEVRDYITYEVNRKYLTYCCQNNIEPKGMISIPEHMINSYRQNLMDRKSAIYLRKSINDYIGRYIDENDNVYYFCYGKQINTALSDIKNLYKSHNNRSNIDYSCLLPQFDNHEAADYPTLFKVSVKNNTIKYPFCRKKIKDKEDMQEYHQVLTNIRIAETLIQNIFNINYIKHSNIVIDDKLCSRIEDSRLDIKSNRILLSRYSDYNCIIHEYIHSIQKHNNEMCMAMWDYIGEITKGAPYILRSVITGNGDYNFAKFKKINVPNWQDFLYTVRIYEHDICYCNYDEMLPTLMGTLIKRDIELIGNKLTEPGTDTVLSMKDLIKDNFNELCRAYPHVGAIVLTFLRGDFKP